MRASVTVWTCKSGLGSPRPYQGAPSRIAGVHAGGCWRRPAATSAAKHRDGAQTRSRDGLRHKFTDTLQATTGPQELTCFLASAGERPYFCAR